jgi:hypothetical protein
MKRGLTMNGEKSLDDERRYVRHLPRDGLMAALSANDGRYFEALGEIMDISNTGLSILYMTHAIPVTTRVSEVTILTYDDGCVPLRKIPCEMIYDVEVLRTSSGTLARRCGVKFRRKLSFFGEMEMTKLPWALANNQGSDYRRNIKRASDHIPVPQAY